MARIVLVTWGTYGDILPLAILGKALKHNGHDILLIGPPDLDHVAEKHGIPFKPCGSPIMPAVQNAGDPTAKRLESNNASLGFLLQQIKSQLNILPELMKGADLVLGSSLAWGAHSAAMSMNVPYRFIAYCPQFIPSSAHPPMVVRKQDRSPWRNRLAWSFYRGASNMMFKKPLKLKHKQWNLAPVTDVVQHFLGSKVLLACDEVFGMLPQSDPPCVQVGNLHDSVDESSLSEETRAFINAGDAPIFAGFGSMPGGNPEAVAKTLIEGARLAGKRIILSSGWGNFSTSDADEDVLMTSHEPYALLFKEVAAVIHHGGSGTTAAAARAGVPQIIVPHMGDQFYFAHRVNLAGLGVGPISLKGLKAQALADAIVAVVDDAAIAEKTAKVAAELANTDPLARAVEFVEGELSASGKS